MPGKSRFLNSDGFARCDHCGEAPTLTRDEMRCSCGNLLARLVTGGVELKCRRCKRTVVLPLEGSSALEVRGDRA
jgi:hypothetical protein